MEITIDGRPLTLEKPMSILEAARLAGVDIPTLCWHPRVSVLGACRLCMIEVVGMNRLLAACTTRVADKMEILTDTPALRKVRQTMLELLLCQHPMDCPTCVKGGACELQALAYKWSAPVNRFPENPGAYPPVDVSPFIERDSRKCVLCRRCVRVCHEVRGVTVLGAMHRGHLKEIGTYFAQPLEPGLPRPLQLRVLRRLHRHLPRRGAQQPPAQVPGAQLGGRAGADRLPVLQRRLPDLAPGQGERAGAVPPARRREQPRPGLLPGALRRRLREQPTARDRPAAAPRRRAGRRSTSRRRSPPWSNGCGPRRRSWPSSPRG